MAPFNTFFAILILAIPLSVVAMPRYTETFSFQVTSLEAGLTDAHCGYGGWPHSCWKYCGSTGQWCWMQPTKYCEHDGDCDPKAPCSSSCGKGLGEAPDFKESDARRARPVANQVMLERPVTNAVKAVAPSGHCEKDSDCDPKVPGSGSCSNGEEASDFKVGNHGISVKLLIA